MQRYELLVCPSCGHKWLTIGAAALSEPEARALVEDHCDRAHPAERPELDAFLPRAKKARPPSNRSRN